MEVFDIEKYVRDSTEKSGVTLKVSDTSTLLSIASQLSSRFIETEEAGKKAS